MKNIFKFLCLAPLLFVAVSCNNAEPSNSSVSEEPTTMKEPTPVDVIVISGQSNAVGCTHSNCITRSMGSSKYSTYMRGFESIKIAYDCWTKDEGPMFYSQNKSKNNDFVKVMLGQGNSEATFGPEIGIAEALHETHANNVFLIKYACGASNLKDDWAKRDSPMYGRFVNYVKAQIENLKSKGYIPTIKAFCWMQGEGDSYDQYYQVYYDNLKEFVGNLRTDLKEQAGNKDFPFIDAGISNAKLWQYYRRVNEAKKQFADDSDNNFYIDTIAAGMHTNEEPFDTPDEAHYDTESEVQLGHLFAEAFEPFLMK